MITHQLIKVTPLLERNTIVVTVQSSDPHALRPFLTHTIKASDLRGGAAPVAEGSCAATALHQHDALVRALRNE